MILLIAKVTPSLFLYFAATAVKQHMQNKHIAIDSSKLPQQTVCPLFFTIITVHNNEITTGFC